MRLKHFGQLLSVGCALSAAASAEPKPTLDCDAYRGVVELAAAGQRRPAQAQLRALEEPFLNERILTDRGHYRTLALGCIGSAPWRAKRAAALLHLDNAIDYRREYRTVRSALNQLTAEDLLRDLGRSGGQAARFAVSSYLALGYSLQASAEPATAIDYFERALRLRPQLAEAQLGIGTVQEKLGNYQAAQAALQAAIALNPSLAEAHLRLGLCLGRLGDDKGARAELERAAELSRSRGEGKSAPPSARIRPGETLPPPEFVHYVASAELGMLELRRERFKQAAALLEQALESDPSEQSTYIALAYAYDRSGSIDRSIELTRRALAVATESSGEGYRYRYDRCQHYRCADLLAQMWDEVGAEAGPSAGGVP